MRRRRWIRRALAGAVVVAGAGLVPAPAHAAPVTVLVLDGTGFGHGVGLSQWGSEYLARTGRTTEEILGTFYPGAQMGEATGPVRVAVHRPGSATTTLSFPQGGEVRSPASGQQRAGFPVSVGPGGQVRITYDGGYQVQPLVSGQSAARATSFEQQPCGLGPLCPSTTTVPPSTTSTTAPPAPGGGGGSTPPPSGGSGGGGGGGGAAVSPDPVVAVPTTGGVTRVDDRTRTYRGVVEATGGTQLRLINLLGVEDYLRGMAEVPSTWPAAAVQAQTVAARTYALRSMQVSGEICDDARCQVYVGTSAESPGQDAAVAATAKQVLGFDGAFATAVYSADAGGVSANTFEGFGTPDGTYPYLRNVRYPTDNPLPWHVEVGLGDVAARFGYPGSVSDVTVSEVGPSGRALELVLHGSAGDRAVDGHRFARSLGLRSTRFTAALGTADGTPAAPAASEEPIQALPEETAELAQRPLGDTGSVRLEGAEDSRADALARGGLPDALDPRRHPASLAALLSIALVAGALIPVAMAQTDAGVPAWARWRSPRRSR